MLTPEYLQLIGEGAEEIASQLHTDIINAIVERITIRLGRGDDYILTPTDKWQIEVLQEAGLLREDIEKEIAKRTKLQLKEIRRAFEDAGVTSTEYDNEVYRAAGLSPEPLQQSPHLIRLMQRAYEATQGEWRNYTRTTADEAQKLFIEQCDKAYNLVSTGAMSYTEAVKNVVETIAADGVTITYPSGHTDTIETATLRAVRTGVSQATAAITDARMDEMNWDIILVSSHLGARVTAAEDFTNHSWWQGKFYSKSGKDPRFPPFSVCGMGNVQGIHGANCRHHHMPGDGENNPFEQYDSEENRKQYELDQRQRALERRIRKTKRETLAAKTAMKNGDEATKAEMQKLYERKAALLQKQNKAYNKFCADNGLKRLQDRLHVSGWNKRQASAASGTVKHVQTVANRTIARGTPEEKLDLYFKEKPVVDLLDKHGIKYIQRINKKEIIVDAGMPKIASERQHAVDNRVQKPDRSEMDIQRAQAFVDESKLTLYAHDRETIKFMAESGYAVLNFENELVTAVPQKWRKKYDKYIEGEPRNEET